MGYLAIIDGDGTRSAATRRELRSVLADLPPDATGRVLGRYDRWTLADFRAGDPGQRERMRRLERAASEFLRCPPDPRR